MSVHYQTNGTWSLALACKNKKKSDRASARVPRQTLFNDIARREVRDCTTTKFIYSENVELPSSERGIRDGLSFYLNYDSDSRKIGRLVRYDSLRLKTIVARGIARVSLNHRYLLRRTNDERTNGRVPYEIKQENRYDS